MKTLLRLIFFIFIFFAEIYSQENYEIAITTEIILNKNDKYIKINWNKDTNATKYTIFKSINPSKAFQEKIAELEGSANSFVDTIVDIGIEYEYQINKSSFYNDTVEYTSSSYFLSGWEIEKRIQEQNLLVLVDYSLYHKLFSKIEEYKDVLISEDWNVDIIKAPRAENFNPKAVKTVKNIIKSYFEEKEGKKAVLLLGRIPVPYSGLSAVDGHFPDHYGAWPAEPYYSVLDEDSWTDSIIVNDTSDFSRQWNTTGDGIFDNSFIPSSADIMIGRVDFYNLNDFVEKESDLIIRYLVKNMNYRLEKTKFIESAAIYDNFRSQIRVGGAYEAWGYLPALFSLNNVNEIDIRTKIRETNYRWVYGAAPGSFNSIFLGLYASEMAEFQNLSAIFNVFGSYNADWDSQDNLLRAILASSPNSVISYWSGRPIWISHLLAFDYTFGDVLLKTLNNSDEYTYFNNVFRGGMHITLMGDPTLKLRYFDIIEDINGKEVKLKDDYKVYGYQIFEIFDNKKLIKSDVRFENAVFGRIIPISENILENEKIILYFESLLPNGTHKVNSVAK